MVIIFTGTIVVYALIIMIVILHFYSSEISNFFKVIEAKKNKVLSCSISQTTLEEVFLRVSSEPMDLIYEIM